MRSAIEYADSISVDNPSDCGRGTAEPAPNEVSSIAATVGLNVAASGDLQEELGCCKDIDRSRLRFDEIFLATWVASESSAIAFVSKLLFCWFPFTKHPLKVL